MKNIIKDFENDLLIRGFTPRTVDSYRGHLIYYGSRYGFDVSTSNLKDFLVHLRDGLGYKPSTISNYFSTLFAFCDFLEFEEIIDGNPIPKFRRRYFHQYKNYIPERRQLISVEQMAELVQVPDWIGFQVIIIFLAKTGIRRNELITLDRSDLNLRRNMVTLKPTAKRTNRIVFFDSETKEFLKAYLKTRKDKKPALFLGERGNRIHRDRIYYMVTKSARTLGFHNPEGALHEKFTPHCTRHWFTTHLRRAGMPREFIQELRGDVRREAVDIYDHIELKELKEAYLKYIPQLGVNPP